jgi:N-acetylmuramoyl-L-alanine amidase
LSKGGEGAPVAELQAKLAAFGYEVEPSGLYEAQTEAVVRAFQRHFRQERVDGVADPSTVATLDALIARASYAQG